MQISALHIESALLEHPRLAEVAVLGLPDAEYGEVSRLFAARDSLSTEPDGLHAVASGQACALAWLGTARAGRHNFCSADTRASTSSTPLCCPHIADHRSSCGPETGPSGGSGGSAAANGSSGGNGGLTLHDLRAWARDRLPPYQLPRHLKVVEAIPRNAMGKVNKKELRKQLFPEA